MEYLRLCDSTLGWAPLAHDGRIPIILGVTGHRDLRARDVPKLRDKLAAEISSLKKRFPSSPLYLLTALAEGADTVAAEVAKSSDVQTIAVLPFPIDDYIQDFTNEEAKQKARALISESAFSIDIEPTEGSSRSDQYAKLAAFIAQHAQIVFAIWDGLGTKPNATLKGGTADVVRMCREGVEPTVLLALPEPKKVVHIFALREGSAPGFVITNENKVGFPIPVSAEKDIDSDARIVKALESVDHFNHESIKHTTREACRDPGVFSNVEDWAAVNVFNSADRLASVKQRYLRIGIVWVALLALISAFFHQVYSGPDMRIGWLFAHLASAGAAVLFFRYIFRSKGRWDQQYLDARALAEGLRVQISWRRGGVDARVTDHYFAEDTDELVWLRHAISNIDLVSKVGVDAVSLLDVETEWIVAQRDYYAGRSIALHRLNGRLILAARTFLYIGLFGTFGIAVIHWMGTALNYLNYFLLGCGSMFLIAGVIKAIGDHLNFGELTNRYKLMAQLFAIAFARFDVHYSAGDLNGCREVLFGAGREALAENATWLRLHRQRQFEVSIF